MSGGEEVEVSDIALAAVVALPTRARLQRCEPSYRLPRCFFPSAYRGKKGGSCG